MKVELNPPAFAPAVGVRAVNRRLEQQGTSEDGAPSATPTTPSLAARPPGLSPSQAYRWVQQHTKPEDPQVPEGMSMAEFKLADANRDGQIGSVEQERQSRMEQKYDQMFGGWSAEQVAAVDRNGDGFIHPRENQAYIRASQHGQEARNGHGGGGGGVRAVTRTETA